MVKEITFKEFNNQYDNSKTLQKAFSTIKNVVLVKNSDTQVIILDEEKQMFYETDYEIDRDTNEITFKNITPLSLKEEFFNTKQLFTEAMDENISNENAILTVKKIAKYITKRTLGGERSKLIRESRLKSVAKRVDEGRKKILEDLNLFKVNNYHVLNDIKSKGSYDRFAEKLNNKYINEDVSVNIVDKINFSFISKRKDGNSPIFKKKLNMNESIFEEKNNKFYNPFDIIKNSPSFTSKLNKLINNTYRLKNDNKDSDLTESKEIFANFATNWPVLYLVSEDKHKEFAIKHFNSQINDKKKAKEYVDIYSNIISSDRFKKEQEKYLTEHKEWSVSEDKEGIKEYYKTNYDAKTIDGILNSISELRESVDKIESKKVSDYLRFAEEHIGLMLRTGKYNETLFERLAIDIFGDNKISILESRESNDYNDKDFKKNDSMNEEIDNENINKMNVQAKASSIVVQLRDLMPTVNNTIAMALEEDLDLVKGMIAIDDIDEKKLINIEKMIFEIKNKNKNNKEEVNEENIEDWCPNCFSSLTESIKKSSRNDNKVICQSCNEEITIDE